MTGEVRKFWTEARLGLRGILSQTYPYTFAAECRVLIQVYPTAARSTVWEKDVFRFLDRYCAISKADGGALVDESPTVYALLQGARLG